MPGSPADVKLVSNAMANATRRKIMARPVESSATKEEIAKLRKSGSFCPALPMLDRCPPLKDPRYATNLEHSRALLEYL